MSVLETLTEGIKARSLSSEGEALLQKWEKTGLLEGLGDVTRNNMARLLENQAAQLLKESSTMELGDVEGFSAVAFPIVRRVFGNLLAQDLVSVQPMSLPSGLIFFLDFTYNSAMAADGAEINESIYGGNVVASQLTGGVDLGSDPAKDPEQSFYALNNGFGMATGSAIGLPAALAAGDNIGTSRAWADPITAAELARLQDDPDIVSYLKNNAAAEVIEVKVLAANVDTVFPRLNKDNLGAIDINNTPANGVQVRRLTRFESNGDLSFILFHDNGAASSNGNTAGTYNYADSIEGSTAAGSVIGGNYWPLEAESTLKEIDIKVDSVAVTAMTRKLKAKWSPELAQDLNAYHNLDAEVELTSILSEQIALEIDQEILKDLTEGATAGTLYWSRSPGKFVDRESGAKTNTSTYPDFTGTVSEWYETLLETVNDVSARIHRKTLRGGANFLVTSPEVASILEFTSGFRASTSVDDDKTGSWGAQAVGSLNRKMDIHVDPYFPRNLLLVGRRGSSFLESGYVYAPYVPLQVTPTIFGVEDFVPRKGVMTRYAKKMVRPDMYGVVVVRDLVVNTDA
tara:strand:- start:2247 stop:3959 length:1713 start_codon:yes stop_codon:yes gene_type:complete